MRVSPQIAPGIVKRDAPLASEGLWVDGDKVRFVQGFAEKIGGWSKYTRTRFEGVCRSLHVWSDLSIRTLIAVGTNSNLYVVEDNRDMADITPDGLAPGPINPSGGAGWGVGPWGMSTWSTPRAITPALIEPRVWSFDNLGKILLAAPNGQTIYQWDPTVAPQPKATPLTNAPKSVRSIFVTPERFVIALGASTGTDTLGDNMNVRWCSQNAPTDWTPTELNTSRERRLTRGRRLIAGSSLGGQVSVIWSDTSFYVHQYTGSKFIFDTRILANNAGLAGPRAFVTVEGRAYWFGSFAFHMSGGGSVDRIPNSSNVRDWVFGQLHKFYETKTVCFYNPRYNEVWFVFVPEPMTEPSLYAMVNLESFEWATGSLSRTAALVIAGSDPRPILASVDGYLYRHEDGTDADGTALEAFLQSSPFTVGQGDRTFDVYTLYPDWKRFTGTVAFDFYGMNDSPDPNGTLETLPDIDKQTVTMTAGTKPDDFRLSARHAALRVRNIGTGSDFRLGKFQLEIQETGE